jgi:K+-sensing histidine kinase KdpD
VVNNRKPLIVNNAYEDKRFYSKIDEKSGLQTNHLLCLPLINRKSECIGAFELVNKKKGKFTTDDRDVLVHLCNYVTIALENAKLYKELKMIGKAKERVINHLSHELLTPISVLKGVIRRLSKKLEKYDKKKAENILEMGHRNVQKLMNLQEKVNDIVAYRPIGEKEFLIHLIKEASRVIHDLMDEGDDNKKAILKEIYDQIESIYKVGETKFEEIKLQDFIDDIFKDVMSRSQRIEFDIKRKEDPGIVVHTDKNILRKVLFGLIKNAFENTPDEGKIEICAYRNDKDIIVDCTDHGVGITRENQEQIFDGFFHTQETDIYSTKKPFDFNAGGAGIDLLRAKILSEKLGFHLSLSSNRCDFILQDSDSCPGKISRCVHIKQKNECYESGGSTFSLRFSKPDKKNEMPFSN